MPKTYRSRSAKAPAPGSQTGTLRPGVDPEAIALADSEIQAVEATLFGPDKTAPARPCDTRTLVKDPIFSRDLVARLACELPPEAFREGQATDGQSFVFIPIVLTDRVANLVFGPGGWSSRILEKELLDKGVVTVTSGRFYRAVWSATVRVSVRGRKGRLAVQEGSAIGEAIVPAEDAGAALRMAEGAAVGKARQKALQLFGAVFGGYRVRDPRGYLQEMDEARDQRRQHNQAARASANGALQDPVLEASGPPPEWDEIPLPEDPRGSVVLAARDSQLGGPECVALSNVEEEGRAPAEAGRASPDKGNFTIVDLDGTSKTLKSRKRAREKLERLMRAAPDPQTLMESNAAFLSAVGEQGRKRLTVLADELSLAVAARHSAAGTTETSGGKPESRTEDAGPREAAEAARSGGEDSKDAEEKRTRQKAALKDLMQTTGLTTARQIPAVPTNRFKPTAGTEDTPQPDQDAQQVSSDAAVAEILQELEGAEAEGGEAVQSFYARVEDRIATLPSEIQDNLLSSFAQAFERAAS